MRVLFVSGEMIAGDLALRLKEEGCAVKLFVADESRQDCFTNMVERTADWKKELAWVGKDGLIVFDDVGYGQEQDDLRKQGYLVFGGSAGGDRLEKDREYGQTILKSCGLETKISKDFTNIANALEYLGSHRAEWVIKQNNHKSSLTYVGMMPDGSDVISLLKNYQEYNSDDAIKTISLQKKMAGIEIGVARYFNGRDWVGPIELNIEHKAFLNGNIGPLTGEMGTIIWYEADENNKLFQSTLAKLKPFLSQADFKGDADINCIVNQDAVFPIEVTSRFGCPSTHLHEDLHLSPWKDFLLAMAKGESYDLKSKKDFGVVVSVVIPPFPYKAISSDYYLKDVDILFKNELTAEERQRIHFEEVSLRPGEKKQYYIAGSNGFILYVTGLGKTVAAAQRQAYDLVKKIVIPKMMYRTDIGNKFIETDGAILKEWGWI
ncbi:MAG: phosphoribosylglycinamide synthetase C domain-containing protein [Patescibacteria group bacterium]|nr:phosphoribosylglycinamide synthetase C domain-containing protein [Patescibacteria group bacterium]